MAFASTGVNSCVPAVAVTFFCASVVSSLVHPKRITSPKNDNIKPIFFIVFLLFLDFKILPMWNSQWQMRNAIFHF
jgi:hypothetical protein